MNQRVLVTGGAGYIGSVLVPLLLENGYAVRVIDSFMYGQTPLLECVVNPLFEVIKADITEPMPHGLKHYMEDVDYIIPLACLTGAPICDKQPKYAEKVVYKAVERIVDLARADQKIIIPTTNSGYGAKSGDVFCTEETPLEPVSLYGQLKVAAEKIVLKSGGVSLRLATAFGISPRMRLDLLVNEFVYDAVTKGHIVLSQAHYKRNYIHVRDIARAFIHAMHGYEDMQGQAYNVGLSDANLSKLELCEEIKKQVPKLIILENDFYVDPDKRNYIVSNAKIEATGYRPVYSLQNGITELIKGYQITKRNQFSNV